MFCTYSVDCTYPFTLKISLYMCTLHHVRTVETGDIPIQTVQTVRIPVHTVQTERVPERTMHGGSIHVYTVQT